MLLKCPECDLQVSDKAMICPHCGYPLVKGHSSQRSSSNKRKRLPNGFGQITMLHHENLRKPYRAMVTVGKTSEGKPISKLLKPESYFKSYNEAYAALLEYNRNPYDLDKDSMTIQQLYDKWTDQYFQKISDGGIRNIKSAWSYCSSIYNMKVTDLRARHIKGCMENGSIEYKGQIKPASAGTKERIKSMFNIMLDYALEYELIEKNYARTFDLDDDLIHEIAEQKRGHLSFTDAEIDLLWQNVNIVPYVDVVLIQCYTGLRPQEIGLIELQNVDLTNQTIKGGMKTNAGKNRIIPIHSKIRHFVESQYNEAISIGSKYLINCTDGKAHTNSMTFTYDKYKVRFNKIRDQLNLNKMHRPHDGRKYFVTQAKKYNVDEYAIKYIVGHAISDITEKVYTERTIDWLKTEIEKIK